MKISNFSIHQLRCFEFAKFSLHPECHVFYGMNGVGKTSVLESIYLLCTGHSFRTREISPLVRESAESLTVFAELDEMQTVSIQKSLHTPTLVKINGVPCTSSAELAHRFPSLVLYQDMFQIMDAGPSLRRSLLDWGMFHVEPSYHQLWKKYRLILKQRNALLRQNANRMLFKTWDEQLIQAGEALDELRLTHFDKWKTKFQDVLKELTDITCEINYEKGWDKKKKGESLQDALTKQFEQDLLRQYTQSGPHQADIVCDTSTQSAKRRLSRGQQKIVLLALNISQAQLLTKNCIYLIDDLAAELDTEHLKRVVKYLNKIPGQKIYTALDQTVLNMNLGGYTNLE